MKALLKALSANDTTEVVAGWTGGDFSSDIDLQDSYINWNKVLGDEFRDFQGNLKLDTDMSNPYVGVNASLGEPFLCRYRHDLPR